MTLPITITAAIPRGARQILSTVAQTEPDQRGRVKVDLGPGYDHEALGAALQALTNQGFSVKVVSTSKGRFQVWRGDRQRVTA